MKTEQVMVEVSIAWWLKYYLYGLAFTAAITGQEVDEEKASRMIDRAIRLRVRSA